VDTAQRSLREDFSKGFAKIRAQGRQFLLQREMPVIPLNTREAVIEQIRRRLGERRT
jgi:hypothetical protein